VVLRDRDSDGNGSLEERHYFCQNWRHDVVAVVDDQGYQLEQARYTPYGEPYAIPFVDQDQDGDVDSDDGNLLSARFSGTYDVRADADLDGDVDFNDISFYSSQGSAIDTSNIGRGVQSSYGHNRGYAGYWRIDDLGLSHVRNRWYDTATGLWLSKDPADYIDGANFYSYVINSPAKYIDFTGTRYYAPGGGIGHGSGSKDTERYVYIPNSDGDGHGNVTGPGSNGPMRRPDEPDPPPYDSPVDDVLLFIASVALEPVDVATGVYATCKDPYDWTNWASMAPIPFIPGAILRKADEVIEGGGSLRPKTRKDPNGAPKEPGQQFEELTEARQTPEGRRQIENNEKSKQNDQRELEDLASEYDGPLPPDAD
jgi:RHS repeat-associated protein